MAESILWRTSTYFLQHLNTVSWKEGFVLTWWILTTLIRQLIDVEHKLKTWNEPASHMVSNLALSRTLSFFLSINTLSSHWLKENLYIFWIYITYQLFHFWQYLLTSFLFQSVVSTTLLNFKMNCFSFYTGFIHNQKLKTKVIPRPPRKHCRSK